MKKWFATKKDTEQQAGKSDASSGCSNPFLFCSDASNCRVNHDIEIAVSRLCHQNPQDKGPLLLNWAELQTIKSHTPVRQSNGEHLPSAYYNPDEYALKIQQAVLRKNGLL